MGRHFSSKEDLEAAILSQFQRRQRRISLESKRSLTTKYQVLNKCPLFVDLSSIHNNEFIIFLIYKLFLF